MPKKIFLIACEPSGDAHGASLAKELRAREPDMILRGLGGPLMAQSGVTLIHDMTTLSALGLGDVLRLYWQYRKIFYRALADVRLFCPDGIVAIDSPAFNLRFAKKIKKQFPFIYYISPQIWAWGMRRIHLIRKTVSRMLVILPFEKEMYDREKVPCEFVGHPLLDHLPENLQKETMQKKLGLAGGPLIGLLSGSRKKEVQRIFPLMLETAREIKKQRPSAQFICRPSSNVPREIYQRLIGAFPELSVKFFTESLPEVVTALDFALITSGTATLETAMLGTPYFLLYKASWSTYILGRWLVKVPYLGLVNLLAKKSVVPEFIQNDIRPEHLAKETLRYLESPDLCSKMKADFLAVKSMLGSRGASSRTADAVLKEIG